MATPHVLVLRAAGTNCDAETAYAFQLAGATATVLHVNSVRRDPAILRTFQMIAIPGGFSYGDDVASGRIFANELISAFGDELHAFVQRGGYIIGVCNGFQVLVKAGLLPRIAGDKKAQQATLSHNTNGRYTDRWVALQPKAGRCAWIDSNEPLDLPIAHGEGRFLASDATLDALEKNDQVAIRYADAANNPNGSARHIAGVCDPTGRVFGLMPHPERFLRWENHPQWTRMARPADAVGAGRRFFAAAVRHASAS